MAQRRLALRTRLAVRMGLALCLGAAVILWMADLVSLRRQRGQLEGLVGVSADRIAETVRRATRDGMLRNDREAVNRIIENIAAQEGIDRIRIYNKEGRVRTSSRSEEEGMLIDVRSAECNGCHGEAQPRAGLDRVKRIRFLTGPGGARVLGIIDPIYNEAACTSCHVHPRSQRVLGVLDVRLSMAQADAIVGSSERQMSWALLATVASVLLLTALLLWGMVLGPVRRLTAAISRAGAGDLTAQVPVNSRDEMGRLAHSWNEMTGELQRAREELEGWNRTLERRVAEKTQALEQTHQRMMLIEKMASLGKLAAVVAHEINNPLAGIRTYARLLRRRLNGRGGEAETAAEAQEADRILQMMDSEAGRCGDIVRNLLAFSRAQVVHFTEEHLAPHIERCRLLLNHQAEILGVTLVAEAAPDLPRITCDAAQTEQMILALAINALEATPSGGRVKIDARPDPGCDEVMVVVADTGCGIPEQDQQRIYEPFFTTKDAEKGVGLGLAVVYGIVQRHRGRIELRSRPGEGTTFTVHLPRTQPLEPAEPEPAAHAGETP
jgi:two-component system NtrC family sensor kinase